MLRCHSISEKHTNPTAQNFHLMAMQGGGGFNNPPSSPTQTQSEKKPTGGKKKRPKKDTTSTSNTDTETTSTESTSTEETTTSDFKGDEDYDNDYGKEDPKIRETKRKAKIKSNKEIIMSFLKDISGSKSSLRPLLVPLSGFLLAYDKMSPKITSLYEKAKTDRQKKLVAEYDKTVEEIVDTMPKKDVDDWTEEDIDEMTGKFAKRMSDLAVIIKKKGKNCPEYAQYRAYNDYLKMCEERQTALANRLGMPQDGQTQRMSRADVVQWCRANRQQARQRNGVIQPMGTNTQPPTGMYQ